MGLPQDFDFTRHDCKILVEVGGGSGRGVEAGIKHGFQAIYCIETKHALALDVALRHADNHVVTVIHARAEKGLKEALEEIPAGAAVLFWLDSEATRGWLAANRNFQGDVILVENA
jgi:hypothetical protein